MLQLVRLSGGMEKVGNAVVRQGKSTKHKAFVTCALRASRERSQKSVVSGSP